MRSCVAGLLLLPATLLAAVLPEERAELMYHSYQGGGMDITGPAVLVRQNFADKVSLSAHYLVDEVSGASIDVVTTASPYTEKRTEKSLTLDYLVDKTIYSVGFGASDESDYNARNFSIRASQEFFGDMTTVSIGYIRNDDTVSSVVDPDFSEDIRRQHYQIGISQVLTRDLLVSLDHELITDQGFLNNPYRVVRYRTATGQGFQSEVYPNTRTSEATALRASYYLPWRAGLHAEYRRYQDSWGVRGGNWLLELVQPVMGNLTLELRARSYRQQAADFYSDLFPFQDAQNFLARDKELSSFSSTSAGLTLAYDYRIERSRHVDRVGVRLIYDRYDYRYRDFRDIRGDAEPGTEPRYQFSANVTQLVLELRF